MVAARSLLFRVGTLAVVGVLWLTLLAGGGDQVPTVTPSGATAPSSGANGASAPGDYNSAIGAGRGAVQQADQDAQRAAGTAPGTP